MTRKRFKRWALGVLILSALIVVGCVTGVMMQMPMKEMSQAGKDLQKLEGKSGGHVHANGVHWLHSGPTQARTTFLFVHGTPGEMDNWGRYLADESLNSKYGLVAFDRLGHGKSKPGKAEPSLKKQSESLAEVARSLPGRKIWVGHSYGVPVIGRLAADFPQLVDGLLLISGSAKGEYEKKTWYQSLGDTWVGQKVMSPSLKVANEEMIALQAELELLESVWAKMRIPITVVHAENDILADFRSTAFLKEQVHPDFLKVVALEKGNHFLIWSHRELITEEMLGLSRSRNF